MKLTFGGAIDIDITTDRVAAKARSVAQVARDTAAHDRRMDIIERPFPAIMAGRTLPLSYPWSGTIIGDNFGTNASNGANRRTKASGDHNGSGFYVAVD